MKLLILLLEISSLLEDCLTAKHETNKFWIWNGSDFFNLDGQIWRNPSYTLNKKEILEITKNTTIIVAVHHMEPYLLYNESSNTISGLLGDSWNLLEETLHFKTKIVPRRDFIKGRDMVKNGEADVFLGATVYTEQTTNMHFSHPYLRSWFHLYFKVPEGRPARYLHFKAFSDSMWLLLLVFYSFLTFMLWLTCFILKKFVPKVETLLSIPTYFLGVMAAFFNTGHDLKLRSYSARLQLISALLFGLVCYSSLSASLVANLTNLDRPKPFSSLEDVWKQNTYAVCMRNITFVYDDFVNKNGTILPKYKKILNTEKCPRNMLLWKNIPESVCKNNIIMFESILIMGLALPHVKCQLTMVPERYNVTGNYVVFSKQFKLREVIALMRMRIWSTGIRKKLKSERVSSVIPIFSTPNDMVNSISFSQISDLIRIYCILMLVCLFILSLELIFELVGGKKKHQVVDTEVIKFKRVMYQNKIIY